MIEPKYLIAIVILLVIFTRGKSTPNPVDAETAKDKIENSEYDHVLDIRTNLEKSVGHLVISTHIPLEKLSLIENIVKNKGDKILVISKNSERAAIFAEYISTKGFTNVTYLNDFWTTLLKN